jgi:hypothetical protein
MGFVNTGRPATSQISVRLRPTSKLARYLKENGNTTHTWTLRTDEGLPMRATIKAINSPDVDNLQEHSFDRPEDVYLLIQLFIGPACEKGEELFTVVVCTAEALKSHYAGKTPRGLRHHLLVEAYDYETVRRHIEKICDRVEGETWRDIGERLNRYFTWEFEDDQEE